MARKSFIEPGSILPPHEASPAPPPSVMEEIIAHDREKSGRAPAPHLVTEERTNKATNVTRLQDDKERSLQNTEGAIEGHLTPAQRDDRHQRALDIAAADKVTIVTVRVSARLNAYMDHYVERVNRAQPKRKYRKQDAIAEAFAAFFAEHPLPPLPAEEEI